MSIEIKKKEIMLPSFKVRSYQLGFMSALDRGFKRVLAINHRRWGKDLCCVNLTAKEAFKRVGSYYYYLPTQVQARKIVWNGMDGTGKKFTDYFPEDVIKRKLDKDMMIELKNGSIIQLIGTDNLDVVGVNPVGCIFSEFSLHNPKAWQYVQPILRENGGWAVINTTPRGKQNHLYRLYKGVLGSKDWSVTKQSILDTGVISEREVQEDIENGLITPMLARQEYYCDFLDEVEGSYYAEVINIANDDGRVGDFEFQPNEVVFTGWDLGIDNAMSIWFFQIIRDSGEVWVRFIDHYENSNKGLEHYVDVLLDKQAEKGYRYGGHLAPHDVRKREMNGLTVQANAEQYGIYFERVPRTKSVRDDIETVRRLFKRFQFNNKTCRNGLDFLAAYHAKIVKGTEDSGKPLFYSKPEHDHTSNTADAFRTCVAGWELGMCIDAGLGEIRVRNSVSMAEKYGKKDVIIEKLPLWESFDLEREKLRTPDDVYDGICNRHFK